MTYNSRLAQELGKWADTQPGSDGHPRRAVPRLLRRRATSRSPRGRSSRSPERAGLPGATAREVLEKRTFRRGGRGLEPRAPVRDHAGCRPSSPAATASVGAQPYETLEAAGAGIKSTALWGDAWFAGDHRSQFDPSALSDEQLERGDLSPTAIRPRAPVVDHQLPRGNIASDAPSPSCRPSARTGRDADRPVDREAAIVDLSHLGGGKRRGHAVELERQRRRERCLTGDIKVARFIGHAGRAWRLHARFWQEVPTGPTGCRWLVRPRRERPWPATTRLTIASADTIATPRQSSTAPNIIGDARHLLPAGITVIETNQPGQDHGMARCRLVALLGWRPIADGSPSAPSPSPNSAFFPGVDWACLVKARTSSRGTPHRTTRRVSSQHESVALPRRDRGRSQPHDPAATPQRTARR